MDRANESIVVSDDERASANDSLSGNDDETGIVLTIDSNGVGSDSNESTDYKMLTDSEVIEEMNRIASDTSVIISYPPSICRTLLHRFKWIKETLLERFYEAADPDAFFRSVHLLNPGEVMVSSSTETQCSICCENQLLTGLQCNHLFCRDCWKGYLSGKIVSEGRPHINCPEQKCDIVLDDESVMNLITDDNVKEAYRKLTINAFVASNPLLKWCPGNGCGRVAKVPHSEPRLIKCECGSVFCFHCSQQWHEPVTCSLLRRWLKKCNDDSETANWIQSHTKDCPRCHCVIEKDGGCNHMTCKNVACRYEFCWMCLGEWAPHGSGYYSCNRFENDDSRLARNDQERSRAALARYLHYFNRYSNHHNSLKLEKKLYLKVDAKMEQMQLHNFSWIETQFLKKAVDVLSECRRTLMYTYTFAYYLVANNTTKILEDNQRDLELATEQLSEFLERDLADENLVTLKQKVQDKYRYVEQRREMLLKHCAEGYDHNQWVFNTVDTPIGRAAQPTQTQRR